MRYNPKIIKNEKIAKDIFEMVLEFIDIIDIKPGNFINISIPQAGMLLKRPISVSNVDGKLVTITYKILGDGTRALSKINDQTIDVLAPLGNSFPETEKDNVLLIGGGIGIPPMLYLAKSLKKKNLNIILATQNAESMIYVEEFKRYGNVHLVTDDGSLGFKGNPISFLDSKRVEFDAVYACGPDILLELLDKKYQDTKEGYISVEERMACGFGVCMGCIRKTKTGYMRVCTEGPVIPFGVSEYES